MGNSEPTSPSLFRHPWAADWLEPDEPAASSYAPLALGRQACAQEAQLWPHEAGNNPESVHKVPSSSLHVTAATPNFWPSAQLKLRHSQVYPCDARAACLLTQPRP